MALRVPESPSDTTSMQVRGLARWGDLQQHLQAMFTLLRPEDNIRLAVRLESAFQSCMRYIVVVSTNGRQDTEESIVLGMDFNTKDRLWSATFHSLLARDLFELMLFMILKEQPADVSSPLARSQSENGISVKDIVTELESINQGCAQCRTDPAAPTPAPAPLKRNTIHDQPGESAKPPRGEEEEGQIPGTSLQRDPETEDLPWPGEAAREGSVPKTGSVKRVTKELEQRLRHEQDLTLLTQKNSRHDETPSIEISGSPYEPRDCEPAPQENRPGIRTEGSSEAPGLQDGVRCETSVGEPVEPAGDNEGSPISETPSTGTLLPDLLSTPRIRIVKITELVPIPTPRPTSPATGNTQAGQCKQAASLEETGHPLEESSVGEKKEDEEEQSKGFVFHQTLPPVGQSVGPCACHLPSQTPDTLQRTVAFYH
ncbi:UNVERIFIED_CONTAM: hypothetical protein FKN15_073485 [Acipenser sinensis]